MIRLTVTIPDDLESELESYMNAQGVTLSLPNLVEAALRRYLQEKRLELREYMPARGPLRISPAERGSGKRNTSIEHDRYFP